MTRTRPVLFSTLDEFGVWHSRSEHGVSLTTPQSGLLAALCMCSGRSSSCVLVLLGHVSLVYKYKYEDERTPPGPARASMDQMRTPVTAATEPDRAAGARARASPRPPRGPADARARRAVLDRLVLYRSFAANTAAYRERG